MMQLNVFNFLHSNLCTYYARHSTNGEIVYVDLLFTVFIQYASVVVSVPDLAIYNED